MINLTRRGAMSAVVGMSGLALLSACGAEETAAGPTTAATTSAPSSATETSSAPTTESSTTEASAETSTAPPAEATPVKINASLQDKEVGDKVEVVSAIRHAAYPSVADALERGGELVLLEVKVTPSGQFGGLIAASAFRLVGANGDQVRSKTSLEAEMKADGKPLLDAPRRDGAATGWVAVLLDEDQAGETYEGIYIRREAKVIGQDKTLPEFTGKFSVPAA